MTNDDENVVSMTNEVEEGLAKEWGDQAYPWENAAGTWLNPYKFSQEDENIGIMTNET